MSSTVACIGFTDPNALAAIVRENGEPFHELSSTNKWVDSSGAMLLLDRTAQFGRPAFSTPVRTPYRNVTPLSNGYASIVLTDISGFELDPYVVVPDARYTVGWAADGRVALVAMGLDIEFFATAEDFFDSPRSALPGMEGEAPPEVEEFGLAWPPAMEIETFLPSGSPGDPTATLSGTVQSSEIRRNSLSGHSFLVSRMATVCGELDLCTPVPIAGVPHPGAIAVGSVQLLAGFPAHGLEDDSAYEPPEHWVTPTFRDDDPESADFEIPAASDDLPEGLVLGEDGVVRTREEHSAWKGGDAEAGSRPAQGAQAEHEAAGAEDAFDDRRPVPDAPEVDLVGENQDAEAVPRAAVQTQAPLESLPPPVERQPVAPTPNAVDHDDDSAPRPGETRREWRARTGR